MLLGFTIHFYIIFGTNLLTGGPAQIVVFFVYFFVSQKKNIKRSPKAMNPWERDFRYKRDPEDLEWTSRNHRGGHEAGARPLLSWAPRGSTDLLLPPIYTYVPPNHRRAPRKPNSIAATFCTCEIPSWGLFRHPARGGIDHGGLLHQHHSLSDDV